MSAENYYRGQKVIRLAIESAILNNCLFLSKIWTNPNFPHFKIYKTTGAQPLAVVINDKEYKPIHEIWHGDPCGQLRLCSSDSNELLVSRADDILSISICFIS